MEKHDPLSHLLQIKKVPHALLVVDGIEHAKNFAKQLVGATLEFHPDIHHLHPEGKTEMHTLESLRCFSEDVSLTTFQAQYKVFLIYEAERMLPTSSNALLKTFEEPPAKTVILLLTKHPEKMLPTILSRCQKLIYHESVQTFQAREAVYACLSGDLSKLSDIETVIEQGHEQIDALLQLVMCIARDAMIQRLKLSSELLFFEESKQRLLPPLNIRHLELRVAQAKLGFERSVKKQAVLRYLFSSQLYSNLPS